jgi:hypothetical protein
MRQRLLIIVTIVVVLGLLILLNALNYTQPKKEAESDAAPDRSTYNAGPTGTRALYDLLSESGYKVTRWREPSDKLANEGGVRVGTFVLIGSLRRPVTQDEARSILNWVERGGRLVIIDRLPNIRLLPKSGDWSISTELIDFPQPGLDPADSERMTQGTDAVQPQQPTLLTRDIRSIRPSRFVATIKFTRSISAPAKVAEVVRIVPPKGEQDESADEEAPGEKPSTVLPPAPLGTVSTFKFSPAPVVHASAPGGAMLVDYAHGAGRIIVLSDPYIVANGGIKLGDNLQLALNTLSAGQGLIAFDEFHQGHAISENALAAYFAGTPILAICGQLVLIVLAIVWTRGRRFGRPLPLPQVDRRSSLEFVASMAELQQRARAFDLALENIYSRTRRVLTRYAGVDYHSSRAHIAERVALRSSLKREQVESLMRKCEDTINGEPINERESIALVRRLRALEGSLGLRMRSRDAKQAAENI